jgi:protein-L-isoaspartate(D-aspartate) O-methyltransferase
MDRAARLRAFYARFVAHRAGARDPRIEAAFAAIPREPFAGPAPWQILPAGPWSTPGYVATPDDDPAFLYQDVLVAIDPGRGINIGEPSLHARCLDALAPREGEVVLHVGAGSGYYSAILAHLVGAGGQVHAFEVEPDLAARAAANLAAFPQASVHARSGIGAGLPAVDAVYVSAGLTQPERSWMAALRPRGRVLFPLQPEGGYGGMLLAEKPAEASDAWPARFVSRAAFIPCQGAQDSSQGQRVAAAFKGDGWQDVRSLRFGPIPDASCWLRGEGWWLSTASP